MRRYDSIIIRIFLLIFILFGGIIFISLILPSAEYKTNLQLIFSLMTLLIGLSYILIYLILLKREQKQIDIEILSLKKSGISVFTKKYEKLLYSRDIADVPSITRLFFDHNTIAITQPKNITELKAILKTCEKFKIPLIPRGKGTSGYGGAIPTKNGIIVNLSELNNILNLDEERLIVEVECGLIWEKLQKFLKIKGLTVPIYPSSSLSSTIGGWVAQGGYGVGSSKYGGIKDNIDSITILDSEGREHDINDPSNYVGNFGIIGIIWKIKLRVIKIRKLIHLSTTASKTNDLINSLPSFQEISPYFLRFISKESLLWDLKDVQVASSITSNILEGGVISITYEIDDFNSEAFQSIIRKNNLILLSDKSSEKIWNDRFYTMRMKRKGPSLTISEVLIPTIHLTETIKKISERFHNRDFSLELITNSDDTTVVMIWFPSDIRKSPFKYIFSWLMSFEVINIARKYNGLPYNSGFWLNPYSKDILRERLDKIRELKKITDPNGIFNPNKVWGGYIPRFFPVISWYFIVRYFIPIVIFLSRIIPSNKKKKI